MSDRRAGPGYVYVICDVCGRKIHQKDAILITNKYNTQHNLLVCKNDADKINPQSIPHTIRENNLQNPKLMRGEPADINVVNEDSDKAPGAPKLVMATLHPINNTIYVTWQGPDNPGSDPILYYKIYISDPQDIDIYTIQRTVGGETSLEDTTTSVTDYVSYRVSAVNIFGEGPLSEIAYFPRDLSLISTGYKFLLTGDSLVLKTGNNEYIIVNS